MKFSLLMAVFAVVFVAVFAAAAGSGSRAAYHQTASAPTLTFGHPALSTGASAAASSCAQPAQTTGKGNVYAPTCPAVNVPEVPAAGGLILLLAAIGAVFYLRPRGRVAQLKG